MSLNRLAPFILRGCLVGAAAVGAMVVMPGSEARAACLATSSSTNCATFSNVTSSSVENFGYTDNVFINNDILDSIKFYQNGFTAGLPIALTDIAYSLDGGTTYITTGLTSTSYVIESSFTNESTATTDLISSPIVGLNLNNFRIRYTIPAGQLAPNGRRIFSFVRSNDSGDEVQGQTRSNALANPAEVPGPLPLIGAAAAFGFSRKLRRRIRQSA